MEGFIIIITTVIVAVVIVFLVLRRTVKTGQPNYNAPESLDEPWRDKHHHDVNNHPSSGFSINPTEHHDYGGQDSDQQINNDFGNDTFGSDTTYDSTVN